MYIYIVCVWTIIFEKNAIGDKLCFVLNFACSVETQSAKTLINIVKTSIRHFCASSKFSWSRSKVFDIYCMLRLWLVVHPPSSIGNWGCTGYIHEAPYLKRSSFFVFVEEFHSVTVCAVSDHDVYCHNKRNPLLFGRVKRGQWINVSAPLQSLYSLSGRTSYRKISRSLEATRSGFRFFNHSEIWQTSRTCYFTTSYGKKSVRLVNGGSGPGPPCISSGRDHKCVSIHWYLCGF